MDAGIADEYVTGARATGTLEEGIVLIGAATVLTGMADVAGERVATLAPVVVLGDIVMTGCA